MNGNAADKPSTRLALDGARATHVQHELVGLADGGLEPHRAQRRIDNVDNMLKPPGDLLVARAGCDLGSVAEQLGRLIDITALARPKPSLIESAISCWPV